MAAVPSCLQSAEMAAATALLGRVETIDKAAKIGMNASKVISAASDNGETVQVAGRLAKSLADGRSMMRMGQWVKSSVNVQKAVDELKVAAGSPSLSAGTALVTVARHAADMGYKLGDNVGFLAKQGVLDVDDKAWAKASKRLQFAAFAADAALAGAAVAAAPMSPQVPRQQANLARAVLDCLMILQATKWVPAYDAVPTWFPSLCGFASGMISASALVHDALQEERKKKKNAER